MVSNLRLSLRLSNSEGSSNPELTTNLLEGLSWIQGTNTTMSIAGDRVRATRAGGNPRVYKTVVGLISGATYRLTGNCFQGTQSGAIILRASETADLPDGNLASNNVDYVINNDFTASATTMHVGIVVVADTDGQYAEISEGLTLVRV